MARHSSIEALPQELFDEINRVLTTRRPEGGLMTIQAIVEHMKTLGADLSKSAVGRHKQKIDVVAEQLRKSRVIAEAIGRELGDKPDDKIADLNIELLHDQVMKFMTKIEDGEMVSLDTKQMREMADALYRMASARKIDADRVLRVRKEVAEKTIKAVGEQLKKSGQPGLTKETVDSIKSAVLGVEA